MTDRAKLVSITGALTLVAALVLWFMAFAPVDNPRIALAVLLENGGGGSAFAAPVARKVIDHYLLNSDQQIAENR